MLSREELIRAGTEFVYQDVTTQAGVVRVAVMSGFERAEWDRQIAESGESNGGRVCMAHMRAVLICLTACDESGNRLFTTNEYETVAAWKQTIQLPIYNAAFTLNKLGGSDLEEEEKN